MPTARLTIDPHFTVGRHQPPSVRLVRRAPRPLRLRRHLRAGPPDRRRRGLPPGRHRAREGARRLDHPLPRRQLRLGLPLGGQRRPARRAAPPPRPRLALDRDQRGRACTSSRAWLDKVGSELMLAVNLGTRGTLEALDLLEYSNIARRHRPLRPARSPTARTEPFGVKMWCLGNEMDGPWQLGHRSADDYGKLASQTAKAMRQLDPSLELVVCGSLERAHADVRRVGARRARATRTTTSTTSRATPTTRRRTATSAASSRRRSTWTASSSPSSRRPTT